MRITKKALKETVYEQTFTGLGVKINVLWFERKEGDYTENGIQKRFAGYKYMVATIGNTLTKPQRLHLLHNWLTTGERFHHRDAKYWLAETDKQRKKPPLQFNWFALPY